MIEFVSYDPSESRWVGWAQGIADPYNAGWLASTMSMRRGAKMRGPGDYIYTSEPFDSFNNKACSHQQWTGTLATRFRECNRVVRDGVGHTFQIVTVARRGYRFIGRGDTWVERQNTTTTKVGGKFYSNMSTSSVPCFPLVSWTFQWSRSGVPGNYQYTGRFTYFSLQANPSIGQDLESVRSYQNYVTSLVWHPSGYPATADAAWEFAYSKAKAFAGALGWFFQSATIVAASGRKVGNEGPVLTGVTPNPTTLRYTLQRAAIECVHHWPSHELSVGAAEIVEQYNDFSSNGLAYIKDLKDVGGTIRSLLNLANGASAKSLAAAWLSGRYGDRLTISDTRELLDGVRSSIKHRQYKLSRSRLEYRGKTVPSGYDLTALRVSTVITKPGSQSGLMTAINDLMRWDIWPTLENTWDLIPFSFVVDWFVSVSDVLDHLDKAVQAPYLNVSSQYASDKLIMDVPVDSDGFVGVARLTRYARGTYPVLSDLKPFEQRSSVPSFGVVNLVDAGAMLVQLFHE